MSAWGFIQRWPARWVAPVLLAMFGGLAALGHHTFRISETLDSLWAERQRHLAERLSIEQMRLDVQAGMGNQAQVRRLVTGLALHEGLDHAYLIGTQGQVLASLSRLDTGQPLASLASAVSGALGQDREGSGQGIVIWPDRSAGRLHARVALIDGRALAVSVDLRQPQAVLLHAVRRDSLLVAALLLVLAGLLAALLHLIWFRRSAQLVEQLDRVARGDPGVRVGLPGQDEMAQIGRAVNAMVERRAEAELQVRHMQEIVNRSPVVVIEWRNAAGWPVVFVSDAVRQWGYGPQDLLEGRLVWNDLIHPADVERVNHEIAAHVAEGRSEYRQRYRLRCADGSWAYVIDDTMVGRDAAGAVTGFSGLLTDVTELERVEAELRLQADRVSRFYELPFIGMAMTSPSSKCWLQVNDRLCEILGYSRERLLTTSWADITHPDDLQDNLILFDELLANQRQSYQMVKRFIRGDGRVVVAELDVRARRLPDGTVSELYTTVQDITDRLQADAQLRRLSAMADNAGEALLMTVDGRIEDCNPAGWQLFGYPDRNRFLGSKPSELSPERQPDGTPSGEAARARIAAALAGQPQRFEWLHRRFDGSLFEAEVSLRRFQLADGRHALIGVVRDITERKAAEEGLRRSEALLLRAQEIARVGSWSQDLVGGLFTWSPQTYAIHEVEPGAVTLSLEAVLAMLHEDDVERVQTVYAACVQAGRPYDIRYRLRMADGRIKHLHVKGEFEFDAGQPVRSVGMVVDETDLVDAQTERDRLVAVIEAASDIVSMADPQGRVFYFNRAGYEMLGLPPDGPLDDVITRVHPPWASRRVTEEGIPTALREGLWLGDSAVYNASGAEVPMSQLIGVQRDAQGDVRFLWTILRDVSQIKSAQAALQLERERLTEAQAVARIGSWSVDLPDGRTSWSEGNFHVFGLDPLRVTPSIEAYLGAVHPEDLERVRAHVAQTQDWNPVGEDEVRRIELRVLTPGGVRHLEERARVQRDAQGRIVRLFGTTMDVTERVEAARVLEETKAMLEQGEALVRMGSWSYDSDTRALHWSDQMFANMGMPWSAQPPSIDEYCERVHPEDVERVRAAIDRLVSAQDVPEVRFRTHPGLGPVRWMRRVIQKIDRSAQGKGPSYIGTLLDITDAVLAEERLRAINEELERRVAERTAQLQEANRDLEAFTYTVSHDLKAPLRGIDGYSQLLMEDYGPQLGDEGQVFLERIRRGVGQMGELIADLLDYSRMERREMEPQPQVMLDLIERAIETYEADIERQQVEVRRCLEPMTLKLDREGMAVVLRNLIGNAIKFSRSCASPVVEVGSRVENDRYLLWVRDNGVGFDMQYHDRIFGIFQRLHRAEEYPGTGVGLALVAKAVQRMGGRVWAESRLGEGATFYLEFPR